MNLRGQQSEKQHIKMLLAEAYSRAKSQKHFLELLKELGLQLYTRGKHIGIQAKRRYRLHSLGYSLERLALLELEKTQRQKQLTRLMQIRQKQHEQDLDLDLEQEL